MTLFFKDIKAAGFLPNEIVHLDDAVGEIQDLNVNDKTISFDGVNLVVDKITKNESKFCDKAVKISFEEVDLTVTPDQMLFLPKINNWIAAKDLKSDDLVLSITGKLIPIIKIEELKEKNKFHDLTIQNQHNFFVTKLGVLVHNDPVLAYFGTLAACKAAEAAACTFSVAAAGWLGYIGYKELNKSERRSANTPFPTFTAYQTQQDQEQLRRMEQQAEKERAKDAKKKAEAAFKKAQQNKKEPIRQTNGANTRTKKLSSKSVSANPLAKEVPTNPLQKNEASEKVSDPLGVNKSEEAKKAEQNPLGVKDKVAESEKPVAEEEAKKADEPEKKLTDKEVEKILQELKDKANTGEKKSAQISENPNGDISKDFDSIPFDAGVKEKETSKGKVRVGEFSNGYKVIERGYSSDGRPTIEFQRPDGRTTDKIRYGGK